MTFASNHPVGREQAKVMNRFDITKRIATLDPERPLILVLPKAYAILGSWRFRIGQSQSREQNIEIVA